MSVEDALDLIRKKKRFTNLQLRKRKKDFQKK
jgi:hypothetical protein